MIEQKDNKLHDHALIATVLMIVVTILLAVVLFFMIEGAFGAPISPPSVQSSPILDKVASYGNNGNCGPTICTVSYHNIAGDSIIVYSFQICDSLTIPHITAINDGASGGANVYTRKIIFNASNTFCGGSNKGNAEIWTSIGSSHYFNFINITYNSTVTEWMVVISSWSGISNIYSTFFFYKSSDTNPTLTNFTYSDRITFFGWKTLANVVAQTIDGTVFSNATNGASPNMREYGMNASGAHNPNLITTASIGWIGLGLQLSLVLLPPTVTTVSVYNITESQAIFAGNLVNKGTGSPNTTCGFYLSQTISFSSSTNYSVGVINLGNFTYLATGLMSNTTYYFKAWCFNVNGLSMGITISFSTLTINTQIINTWIDGVTLIFFITACILFLMACFWVRKHRGLIPP